MKKYQYRLCIPFVGCALVLFVFLSPTVNAASISIGSMSITGGSYAVWDSTGALITNPDSGSPTSAFTTIGPNTNLVGGYIGNGGAGLPYSTPDPASIVEASWFGSPLNTYTSASNLGDSSSPAGSISGGAVPSGVLDSTNNTIFMNLGALFGNWDNIDFNIGTGKNDGITSALASGSWNPVTGAYSLTWTTTISNTVGGPCLPAQCIAQFNLDGLASPVPIPAALWLFGSGFVGLIGFAYRRRPAGIEN